MQSIVIYFYDIGRMRANRRREGSKDRRSAREIKLFGTKETCILFADKNGKRVERSERIIRTQLSTKPLVYAGKVFGFVATPRGAEPALIIGTSALTPNNSKTYKKSVGDTLDS
jgi:hypothetical protein